MCEILPQSFRINFKDKSFSISIGPLGFYFSPRFLLNFLLNQYIPLLLEKVSKFMLSKLLENTFVSQKNWKDTFYSCPKKNSPPGSYHSQTAKLLIPPRQYFLKIYFPSRKGDQTMLPLFVLHFNLERYWKPSRNGTFQ